MRRTNNWKHNGKGKNNKKQYMRNGYVKVANDYTSWELVPIGATPGYLKRKSEFMDLSDVDLGFEN